MTKRALCIGINDYPGSNQDLQGCVNDANDWAAELERNGYTVTTLLDRRATGAAIRGAMRRLITATRAGDRTVITFSGHGSFVEDRDGDEADGQDECLCPYDVVSRGEITDDELFRILSRRHPESRLVTIVDACHSGTIARFRTAPMPLGSAAAEVQHPVVRFMPPAVFLGKKRLAKMGSSRALRRSSPPGRYAGLSLSGCMDAEYSFDAWFGSRPNGAFTYTALRALERHRRRSRRALTYQEWFDTIRRSLPSPQYAQTPQIYGASTDKSWAVFQ